MTAHDVVSGVAVVTGAGSGIGRATALALGERGIPVASVGRRSDRLFDTTASAEGPVTVIRADVATLQRCELVEQSLSGRVRYPVHDAGDSVRRQSM